MSSMLLTKLLTGDLANPKWPDGFRLVPFVPQAHALACHDLMSASYTQGQGTIEAIDEWWASIETDDEYLADGLFLVVDSSSIPAAFGHCWSSAFLKDFAVSSDWRRKGLGTALLSHMFIFFRQRGFDQFRLKVRNGNDAALAFYLGLDMQPTSIASS